MKNFSYTFKAVIVSIMFWLIDTIADGFFHHKGEYDFFPSEINELWMRLIIVLLFIAFGLYADKQTKAILKKEAEKHAIYQATITSTQHILNNLLHQMKYFKTKIDKENIFDAKLNDSYERAIAEGVDLVKKLSAVEELTETNIRASVYPVSD